MVSHHSSICDDSIQDGPEDDLIKNLNYTLSKDPWKKISDAETVHGLDGSTKKRDRIWHLRQEGRRGIGGSDRKPRPIRRDDSRYNCQFLLIVIVIRCPK